MEHHLIERTEPAEHTREYCVHQFEYADQYTDERFDEINQTLGRLALEAKEYYGDTLPVRSGRLDMDNPATQWLIQNIPSFKTWWRRYMPTEAALDPLEKPDSTSLAGGEPLDPELGEYFKNSVDGRGIRSRKAVVKDIFMQDALRLDHAPQWLSLASGAARSIIETVHSVDDARAILPSVTLVDADRRALSRANEYADQRGVADAIQTIRTNILHQEGINAEFERNEVPVFAVDAIRRVITNLTGEEHLQTPRYEGYDIVEAVGIVEYLGDEDRPFVYSKVVDSEDEMMAGARTFLKNAYRFVRPGGLLVFGNMLDTHPQLGFTLDVIQWPHVQPRSINSVVKLLDEAGVEGETDVYTPADGAYAIYKVRKPE
jgi:SAM-dependent methyltransferase